MSYVDFGGRNQKFPLADIENELFGFAMDKTLKEIRKIFHASLLNIHLERTKNAPEMCRHLEIDTRTYFLYQKKLGLKRGEPKKAVVVDNPYFEQYIQSLVPLTWKEANKRFEGDLFSYLLTQYQSGESHLTDVILSSRLSIPIDASRPF